MVDIHCHLCGEPWDVDGLVPGSMNEEERIMFLAGQGCPACNWGTRFHGKNTHPRKGILAAMSEEQQPVTLDVYTQMVEKWSDDQLLARLFFAVDMLVQRIDGSLLSSDNPVLFAKALVHEIARRPALRYLTGVQSSRQWSERRPLQSLLLTRPLLSFFLQEAERAGLCRTTQVVPAKAWETAASPHEFVSLCLDILSIQTLDFEQRETWRSLHARGEQLVQAYNDGWSACNRYLCEGEKGRYLPHTSPRLHQKDQELWVMAERSGQASSHAGDAIRECWFSIGFLNRVRSAREYADRVGSVRSPRSVS